MILLPTAVNGRDTSRVWCPTCEVGEDAPADHCWFCGGPTEHPPYGWLTPAGDTTYVPAREWFTPLCPEGHRLIDGWCSMCDLVGASA